MAYLSWEDWQKEKEKDGFSNKKETINLDKSKRRYYSLPKNLDKVPVILRHLSPGPTAKTQGIKIWKHFYVHTKSLICYRTFDMPCPICETLNKIKDLDVSKYVAQLETLFQVLVIQDLTQKIDPKLPMILTMRGIKHLDWIIEQDYLQGIDITDVRSGNNISLGRDISKKAGTPGAFKRNLLIKQTPIADTEEGIQEILSNSYDLTTFYQKPDDYLHKFILGRLEVFKDGLDRLRNLSKENEKDLVQNKENNFKNTNEQLLKNSTNKSNITTNEIPKSNPTLNLPPDKVNCFGFKYVQDSNQCNICNYEFQCKEEYLNKNGDDCIPF